MLWYARVQVERRISVLKGAEAPGEQRQYFYSIYLLYWYKSTNTNAEAVCC